MTEAPTVMSEPQCLSVVRRCPTLPHSLGCSTIGAVGLSFRVRNGTGRFPHAMTAVTLLPATNPVGWCGKSCGYNIVVLLFSFCSLDATCPVLGLLVGNHIVDASSLVYLFTLSWCERLLIPFTEEGVWCKLSAY